MVEEEKGFVIKDRRALDDEGTLKQEEKQAAKGPAKQKTGGAKPDSEEAQQRSPLPEVNFSSLIFSLSSSALLHLGEIADPQSGQKTTDLALAKHSIDIIAMLKEKTKGNLNDEEKNFVESILTDLRLRFVKASK